MEFPEGSTARQPEEFPHVVPGLPRLPFQLEDVLLFGGRSSDGLWKSLGIFNDFNTLRSMIIQTLR